MSRARAILWRGPIGALVAAGALAATGGAPALARSEHAVEEPQRKMIAEALRMRSEALARKPDDPLAGAWMVESAELLLAELALTGADSTAVVGVATAAQFETLEEQARRALQLAEAAEAALGAGVAAVETAPTYADDESLRELRRRLAVEFQMFRAPMARARARLILAGLAGDDGAQRARLAQAAQDELLDMRLPAGPAEAQRLTGLGLAELFGARRAAPPDQPLRATLPTDIPVWFDIALTLEAERPFWTLPARERVEATVGKALASARGGRASAARLALENAFGEPPAQSARGGRSARWTLLIADGLYRVGLAEATTAPGAGSQWRALAQACDAYAWLISLDALGGLGRAELVPLIFEKVAAHAARAGGLAKETPLAVIARARSEARSGEPQRLQAAIDALEQLVGRPRDEVGQSRVAGLRTLALAHARLADRLGDDGPAQAEHGVKAAEALLSVAREHAAHPDAAASAQQAEALLASIAARVEASGSEALAQRWRQARREALRLLVDGLAQKEARDRARLALADAALTPSAAERLTLLASIGPASPRRAAAQLRIAEIALAEGRAARALEAVAAAERALESLGSVDVARLVETFDVDKAQAALARLKVEALLALDRLDEAAEAAVALAPVAREREEARATLERAVERLSAAWGDALHAERAQRLIALRSAALAATPAERESARLGHLRALARLHGEVGQAQARAEALGRVAALSGAALDALAHAEALRDAGQTERAFALLREIAERESGDPLGSAAYWRAWAGMLETLAEQARREPAKWETIAAALARLRAIAADLGPDAEAQRRLRAVEAALASADGAR